MKKILAILFIGTGLVLGACSGGEEVAEPEEAEETEVETEDAGGTEEAAEIDVAAAEEIFQQNCASCHGGDLSGGAGPPLAEVGAKYTEEEILEIIHEGPGAMRGDLIVGEEAELVAAWLVTKQ